MESWLWKMKCRIRGLKFERLRMALVKVTPVIQQANAMRRGTKSRVKNTLEAGVKR